MILLGAFAIFFVGCILMAWHYRGYVKIKEQHLERTKKLNIEKEEIYSAIKKLKDIPEKIYVVYYIVELDSIELVSTDVFYVKMRCDFSRKMIDGSIQTLIYVGEL